MSKKYIYLLIIICWAITVSIGFLIIFKQNEKRDTPARSAANWPAPTIIKRERQSATLIMVIHPQCPCSRASISELARIMVEAQGRLKARVLFFKPSEFSDDWVKTDLWQAAAEIPDVSLIIDTDGIEARKFHADISGQVMLYSATGDGLFNGGITAAQGHYGDNDGHDAIISLLTKKDVKQIKTTVYGCRLFKAEIR